LKFQTEAAGDELDDAAGAGKSVELGIVGIVKNKFLFMSRPKPIRDKAAATKDAAVVAEPATKRQRLVDAV